MARDDHDSSVNRGRDMPSAPKPSPQPFQHAVRDEPPTHPPTTPPPAPKPFFASAKPAEPAEPAKPKYFPVTLLHGYYPKDPDHPKHPLTGDAMKVEKGCTLDLPADEAKEMIAKGIAVRADELPG